MPTTFKPIGPSTNPPGANTPKFPVMSSIKPLPVKVSALEIPIRPLPGPSSTAATGAPIDST